jgi:hypothetical protein
MRRYQLGRNLCGFLLCLISVAAFAQPSDPVTVSYEPVWVGLGNLPVVPVQLEVNNVGKPEVVQIKWGSGQTEVSTFFDMPTGATKKRVVYLNAPPYYGMAEIRVRRGFIDVPLSIELGNNSDYEAMKIGIISDVVGFGSVFNRDRVKPGKDESELKFAAGVAKPGVAPDRSVGYRGLEALFLSEGAERLTDAEVAAIKLAVLQGLNLVFVGGTISPVVNDSRWAEFLPVVPTGEVRSTLPPKEYIQYGPAVKATPMLVSTPKQDANRLRSGDVVVEADRSMGLGSVTFLAFDPFNTTWKQWPGRFSWLEDICYGTSTVPDDLKDLYSRVQGGNEYEDSGLAVDVFGIQMPSAGRITAVLISYLILVVPVNFLILRKLKRGELAWITAPLIALGCAGILFAFAGKLYSAQASRYSSGYLLGSDGLDEGVFVGSQQIFFPGTGNYDLGLQGVEFAGSGEQIVDQGPFTQVQTQNSLVDMGEVSAPNYSVSNLSFRQLRFTQRLPLPSGWVKAAWAADGKSIQGTITNPLPSELLNVKVVCGKKSAPLGLIGIGSTKSFELKGIGPKTEVWVQADVGGSMVGSQYGKSVGKDSVKIHYSILGGLN